MSDCAEVFAAKSVALLTEEYLPKLTRSIAALTEFDVWWAAQ